MSDTNSINLQEATDMQKDTNSSKKSSSKYIKGHIYNRILLSFTETSKVIGTKGSNLKKVRDDNNVQISVSKPEVGCSDRILYCGGSSNDVAHALKDVVDIMIESMEPEEREQKQVFPFLKSFMSKPKITDFKNVSDLEKVYSLRLILSNNQISTIFGKGGNRIKSLIEKHDVRITGSKNFLPDSEERTLEIQGLSSSIASTIIDINETLATHGSPEYLGANRYHPHYVKPENPDDDHRHLVKAGSVSRIAHGSDLDTNFSATVLVPEYLVGAMIGARGNRIVNLKRFTKTAISANKDDTTTSDNGELCRKFIVTGSNKLSVQRAEAILVENLDNEVKKYQKREASR